MAQRKLYLIRHGQSEVNILPTNVNGVFLGGNVPDSLDHLTTLGISQVNELVDKFKKSGIFFDAIYSSDLRRAVETAELLRPRLISGGVLEQSSLIREQDWSDSWNQLSNDQKIQKVRSYAQLEIDGYIEHQDAIRKRWMKFFNEKVLGSNSEHIAVIGHGGVSNIWVLALLGITDVNPRLLRARPNCSIMAFTEKERKFKYLPEISSVAVEDLGFSFSG